MIFFTYILGCGAETTTDEAAWLARLLEYGIVPEYDEQGNLI